jgi:alpha/beta superfamily hydrolase
VLIQQVAIPVSHGSLEGILQTGAEDATMAVVVCHPHPLYGGTMHNKVVFHAAKAFGELGWPVLRFNFRGVGASTGSYADGIGELDDALAALDFLGAEHVLLAGFSFGSRVALTVGPGDERVVAVCGIGVPIASASLDEVKVSAKPKLFVQGSLDEHGPRAAMEPWYASVSEPKHLDWIEGADHFFNGHEELLKAAIISYFGETLAR